MIDGYQRWHRSIGIPGNDPEGVFERLRLPQHVVQAWTVREERHGRAVAATIGIEIGPDRGAQQGDPHATALDIVSEAPVVEHGDAEARLRHVDPTVGAHLELRRIP